MSIFAIKQSVVTENFQELNVGEVEGTEAGMQAVITDTVKENYQLNAAMYVSDIMIESAVAQGQETEALLESFVSGTWEKLKAMFQTLWNKVKKWFDAVKRQLQLVFASGEKFVKQFKQELREKPSKGFSYTGYKYTLDAGASNVSGKIKALNDAIAESVQFSTSDDQKSTEGQTNSIKGANHGSADSHNLDDAKKALRTKLGSEEQSEILEGVRKAFRGGEEEKEEIEDFSANGKEEMIKLIEDSAAKIREIDNANKDIDTQFNRVLASINKAKTAIEREKGGDGEASQARARQTAYATHKYNVAHYALTLISSLNAAHVEAIKSAAKDYESVLKSFLRFKPAKEGYSEVPAQETNGIFESAMRWV